MEQNEIFKQLPAAAEKLSAILDNLNLDWTGLPKIELRDIGGKPHLACTLTIVVALANQEGD